MRHCQCEGGPRGGLNPVFRQCSHGSMGIEGANLRGDEEIVYRLLDKATSWRVRAVERIEYSSSLWVDRTRVIHVAPLREVLGETVSPDFKSAWIRLPVGAFPRLLLFGFEVKIAEREVYRITAHENGKLLAGYLLHTVKRLIDAIRAADGTVSNLQMLLLEKRFHDYLYALCSYEAGEWQGAKSKYGEDALVRYLQNEVFSDEEQGWRRRAAVRRVIDDWGVSLRPVLSAFRDRDPSVLVRSDNPASNPLLVLPSLKANGVIGNSTEATAILRQIVDFLSIVQEWRDSRPEGHAIHRAAVGVLSALDFIGDHWVAFVDGMVPLDEPFSMKVAEQRGMELPRKGNPLKWIGAAATMRTRNLGPTVVLSDAATNHVSLKIADPNVEFGGTREVPAELEETREKDDLILVYSKGGTRPTVKQIRCVIQPTLPLRMIHWVVATIVIATIGALIGGLHRFRGELIAAHVALLLTPSTFASALLLSRESSTLSGALAKRLRVFIACLLGGLWLFAICEYLAGNIVLDLTKKP